MPTLGPLFEDAVLVAAGLHELNAQPGTLHISSLASAVVTVRATVVCTLPGDVVRRIASDCLS